MEDGGYVDMKKDDAQMRKESMPFDQQQSSVPVYPYGLSISLGNDELDKLNLDGNCEVGDMVHVRAFGEVTACSQNKTNEGAKRRVEIQITHIALADDHEDSNEGEDHQVGDENEQGAEDPEVETAPEEAPQKQTLKRPSFYR